MAGLEFTDAEFNAVLRKAPEFYQSLQHVRCPYSRADVQFNSEGLEHLRRKVWNRGRSRSD